MNIFKQSKFLLRRFATLWRVACKRAAEQRIVEVAGSLTFTTMLSLVPLMVVALALLTAFPLFAELRSVVEKFMVENLMPVQSSGVILQYINQFVAKAKGLTVVGLLFLMVTAVSMLFTIDKALNNIWLVRKRRPMTQRLFVYWAVLTLGPFMLAASLSLTSYFMEVSAGFTKTLSPLLRLFLGVVPVGLTGVAYAALFRVVPNRVVCRRDALIGGFVAAILFELSKLGFAFYIARFPNYAAVYGAFAVLPLFILWIFVSWLVTLFGATITATLPLLRDARYERQALPGSDFADALALLNQLYLVRHRHPPGHTLEQLCRVLVINPYDVERLLSHLKHLGYVAETVAVPPRWLWVADAQCVTLKPLYERLVFAAPYLAQAFSGAQAGFSKTYPTLLDAPAITQPLSEIFASYRPSSN